MEPRTDASAEIERGAPGSLGPNGLPALHEEAETGPPEGDDAALLHGLQLFVRTGRLPAGAAPDLSVAHLTPAPLFPLLDATRVRTPYPVCLPEHGGAAVTLTTLIDEAVARVEGEGDEQARAVHALGRLERALRIRLKAQDGDRLSTSWDAALEDVLAQTSGRAEKRTALRQALETARDALPLDGPLLGCTPGVPLLLLRTLARAEHTERVRRFAEEADTLGRRLDDLLAVDASDAPEAHRPDHLQATLGDDIDPSALAHLLDAHPLGATMPEERRDRLQSARQHLADVPAFLAEVDAVCTSCAEGMTKAAAHLETLTDLTRALHVARLEVDNHYRPDTHGTFFDPFSVVDLSDEEVALCPPVLIHLHGTKHIDRALLADLLGQRLPVKILVTLDRACDEALVPVGAACTFGGVVRLGAMAFGLGTAFVLQTPASDVEHLQHGLRAGLRFDGPALYCVYTGDEAYAPGLDPFLRTAVAGEARALPAFLYDPGAGTDWAARFSIADASQAEHDWPISLLEYQTTTGDWTNDEVAFTFADFLACDPRFARHFLPVRQAHWHPRMIPVAEYITLDAAGRAERLPYLLMTSDDATLYRVVTTDAVAHATQLALDHWHSLQELGGLNNSYARRSLEQARKHLEAEKQQALDEQATRHQEAMDRAIGHLAEEIIANIAAGLLSLPATGALPAGASTPPTSPPSTAAPAAETSSAEASAEKTGEAAPAPADDEPLSLDEPYVETLRCTSCNECTNLNGLLFAYDENKQAYIKDASAGTYRELVEAAERCPVAIIHPGKPMKPDEPGLDALLERARPFL